MNEVQQLKQGILFVTSTTTPKWIRKVVKTDYGFRPKSKELQKALQKPLEDHLPFRRGSIKGAEKVVETAHKAYSIGGKINPPTVASFGDTVPNSKTVNLRHLLPEQQDELATKALQNLLENKPPSLKNKPSFKGVKDPLKIEPKLLNNDFFNNDFWKDFIEKAVKKGQYILIFLLKHRKLVFLVTSLGVVCIAIFLKKRRSGIPQDTSAEEKLVLELTMELVKELNKLNNDLEKVFKAIEIIQGQNHSSTKGLFGQARSVKLDKDGEKKKEPSPMEPTFEEKLEGLNMAPLQEVSEFVEQAKSKAALRRILENAGLDLDHLNLLSGTEKVNLLLGELVKAKIELAKANAEPRRMDHELKISLTKEKVVRDALNEMRRFDDNLVNSKNIPYGTILATTLILVNPNALQTLLITVRFIFRNVFPRRFPGDHR